MKIERVLELAGKVIETPAFGSTLRSPFKSLICTMLSARTRDEATAEVCRELMKKVSSFEDILETPLDELEKIIRKTGFYKTKARYMKGIARMVLEEYGGQVPDTIDELVKLPGVGRKTANLVVSTAFGRDAVCVDTHVHRICNRTGVVATKNPNQTEAELRRKADKKLWSAINSTLVPFGKEVCTPISPRCSACPVTGECPKTGVKTSR